MRSNRLSTLTPRDRMRLASILARLASPYEGERAAAALVATSFVEKHGLDWRDLTALDAPEPMPPPSNPATERRSGTSRPWRGYCRRHPPPSGHALSCLA